MTTIHHGDCIQVMNAMPPESVDAIVTDPPYGLGFMGKKWDSLPPSLEWAEACYRVLKPGGHIAAFGGTRTWHRLAVAIEDAGFEMRDSLAWLYGSGFPKSHDVSKGIDKLDASEERTARAREFQSWLRQHVTPQQVNAATGTDMGHHLTTHPTQPAVATANLFDRLRPHLPEVPERIEELVRQRTVESENFKRREVVGTARMVDTSRSRLGFAGATYGGDGSSRDVALTVAHTDEAAAWQGWGTALKPAFEPIVLARKPLAEKTVARNVLAHGTGAINIDGCRIEGEADRPMPRTPSGGILRLDGCHTVDELRALAEAGEKTPTGRDARKTLARYEAYSARREEGGEKATNTGRWPANVLLDHHAAAWVDEQSGITKDGVTVNRNLDPEAEKPQTVYGGGWKNGGRPDHGYGGSGGASRFFYNAKAPKRERPNVDGVQHPTVKPLAIMRWLIRLTTPPGGTVLDPFAGSGTTIEAALIEGFNPVGIEMEADYLPLIQHRIDRQAGTLTD